MKCAWNELLNILPVWMRQSVDELGRQTLLELRLRAGYPPELKRQENCVHLKRVVSEEDLRYIVNTASQYSPWAAETVRHGYITAQGGHRIGLCGEAVVHEGAMKGVRRVDSLCIRVARDFVGIGDDLRSFTGSMLIIGRPGAGKTTLLRDLIRLRGRRETVAVVDERGELFPQGAFHMGARIDVLSGCPKPQGIEMLLRVMGPDTIAVDEITSQADCDALIRTGWCGVTLLATAHAASVSDLKKRPVYQPLIRCGLFETAVVLQADRSWRTERMGQ
ncbi:MAG: stage III sporulation protein AB [Ruminococcaceae bacterium]|nr:stage III sporulation protein AB [Oscillospiraceae bacterium]